MSIPKSMQPVFDSVEPLITDFCNQYLNDEYRELCLHLLEKLCRKRPSPLLTGRKNTWAAAIIYAIATNNFIFDKDELSGKRIAAFACQSGSGGEKAFSKLLECIGQERLAATLILNDPKDRPKADTDQRIEEFRSKLS